MQEKIFCKIRKKYVAYTPEESVRQHIITLLNQSFNYPLTRFRVESQIQVGKLDKRYDILVVDKSNKPFMLIECKQNTITLDENVFAQVTRYNITLNAKYILITNGLTSLIFRSTNNGYIQQKTIPHLI